MAMLLKCIYCAINESVYHNFTTILQAMLMNKNRVISENFYFRGDGTVMILQTFCVQCIRLHSSRLVNIIGFSAVFILLLRRFAVRVICDRWIHCSGCEYIQQRDRKSS